MTNISDLARSQVDVMYRLSTIERQIQQLQTARRLEAAQVGRGGIRITDGGSLRVQDGGGVTVDDVQGVPVDDAELGARTIIVIPY